MWTRKEDIPGQIQIIVINVRIVISKGYLQRVIYLDLKAN